MNQVFEVADEAGTAALGRALAPALRPPAVVALVGPLGAGKTRLAQAVATALGVTEDVTSPTFVLVNEYRGDSTPVYHLDAYRLRDEDEFIELGVDEYFAGRAAAGPGVTLVEWGDRFPGSLPSETVWISIEVLDGTARRFAIDGLEAPIDCRRG